MRSANIKTIMFVHAREPKEIQKLKDRFGEQCITVVVTMAQRTHVPDNHADQNVLNYEYDFHIENDGTLEDLSVCAEKFVATITQ
jgi:imidazole glycerol phosphate synthase subunit HisF